MTSHRQIFRSSAIIGGASIINIVIGIINIKVLAVLLGPAGVGLMGVYQNIMGMASTLAGCGLGGSGVRQLAASVNEADTLAIVRRTLWLANLILGLGGMVILWLLREPVAQWVLGDTAHVNAVGWLGLGVFLSLVAGSQTALLQGLRRIGDLARVKVVSAMLGAIMGILLVYWLGEDGVLWFVLTAPAISILVAGYYAAHLPHPQSVHDWQAINQQWKAMLKLGLPFMATGLLGLATQLGARSIIMRELGLEAGGYFQAAWTISITYIGFVLGSMGADYYPRLTAVINDHPQARKMINEQAEMALLMAGPALLGMITFAPSVIQLLYSESFAPVNEVLRWQVMGGILKVASWPMGYILLAQGRGGIFIVLEQIWNATYIGVIFVGIDEWGLVIVGVGFWISYIIYYGLIASVASRLIGFKPTGRNLVYVLILFFVSGMIMYFVINSAGFGYIAGVFSILATSIYSILRLNQLLDLRGWAKKKFN